MSPQYTSAKNYVTKFRMTILFVRRIDWDMLTANRGKLTVNRANLGKLTEIS